MLILRFRLFTSPMAVLVPSNTGFYVYLFGQWHRVFLGSRGYEATEGG